MAATKNTRDDNLRKLDSAIRANLASKGIKPGDAKFKSAYSAATTQLKKVQKDLQSTRDSRRGASTSSKPAGKPADKPSSSTPSSNKPSSSKPSSATPPSSSKPSSKPSSSKPSSSKPSSAPKPVRDSIKRPPAKTSAPAKKTSGRSTARTAAEGAAGIGLIVAGGAGAAKGILKARDSMQARNARNQARYDQGRATGVRDARYAKNAGAAGGLTGRGATPNKSVTAPVGRSGRAGYKSGYTGATGNTGGRFSGYRLLGRGAQRRHGR